MAMQQGEKYACQHCGCEVQVTRGANENGGNQNPQCCCGREMQQQQQ